MKGLKGFQKGENGMIGKKHSEKTKILMSLKSKGICKSETHKHNMSLAKLKNPTRYWLGKKRPSMCGENNPRWNGGKSTPQQKIRMSLEWKLWRSEVFERDNYTCQECGASGVYIEPHHIIPVRSNKEDTLFNINNGITLCRPCHIKTFGKESSFEEKYSKKVEAQM